jgi:hypothetical protein
MIKIMYAVTGYLYKNDKLLLRGMWEDLVDFVEELKESNPKFVNRKDFKILDSEGYILKEWFRK